MVIRRILWTISLRQNSLCEEEHADQFNFPCCGVPSVVVASSTLSFITFEAL